MNRFIAIFVGYLAFGVIGDVYANGTTPSVTGTYHHPTFEIWCNPRADWCSFIDDSGQHHEVAREELPNYFPIAPDTSDCMHELCYDENMEAIGLNPDYHLYRHLR